MSSRILGFEYFQRGVRVMIGGKGSKLNSEFNFFFEIFDDSKMELKIR